MGDEKESRLVELLSELERVLVDEREALRVLDAAVIEEMTARKVALEAQLGVLAQAAGELSVGARSHLERVRELAQDNHLLVVHARSCVRAGIAAATGAPLEEYPSGRQPGATQMAAVKVDIRG